MTDARETTSVLHYPAPGQTKMRVFVRDYETVALIGVWAHEHDTPQRLRFSITMDVENADGVGADGAADQHAHVVCYQDAVTVIENIIKRGHVGLVETLGRQVIDALARDPRISAICLSVEKPDAITAADAVGVELHWSRAYSTAPHT